LHIQALGLDVDLCAEGDNKVDELIRHLTACEHCQREAAKIIDGFPLARLLGGNVFLALLKGKNNGRPENNK